MSQLNPPHMQQGLRLPTALSLPLHWAVQQGALPGLHQPKHLQTGD